jgi:hypothetical protein
MSALEVGYCILLDFPYFPYFPYFAGGAMPRYILCTLGVHVFMHTSVSICCIVETFLETHLDLAALPIIQV